MGRVAVGRPTATGMRLGCRQFPVRMSLLFADFPAGRLVHRPPLLTSAAARGALPSVPWRVCLECGLIVGPPAPVCLGKQPCDPLRFLQRQRRGRNPAPVVHAAVIGRPAVH